MHDETLLSFEEMQERGHKVEPHITVTANDGWVFTGTNADVSHKLRAHEQQLAQEEVRVRALAQEESNRVIVKALRLTRHAMEAILHVDEAFEGRSHVRRMEAIDKSIKAQKAACSALEQMHGLPREHLHAHEGLQKLTGAEHRK